MPVQHSAFNESTDARVVGNMAVLPLRTRIRGPAFPTEDYDIIDEVVDLFRVNSFFRNFEIWGPADRTLIYGILFVNECLQLLKPGLPFQDAQKQLNVIAADNFSVPGEPKFSLNSVFQAPQGRGEIELLKSYLSQFRQELATRLLVRVYGEEPAPSKHWLAFSRKRFMNLNLRDGR